jgi:hypothetical protein
MSEQPAVSIRALAKRIGASDRAVRKRFQRGCFPKSMALGPDGHPVVLDADLAVEEWEQSSTAFTTLRTRSAQRPATLVGAQLLEKLEKVESLRLANGVKSRRLVDVDKVAKEAFEDARVIREAVLNVPARIAAELAAESDAGKLYIRLDAALREALSASADQLMAANG